jgi:beta-aspartyl-peptidase (threonine type)
VLVPFHARLACCVLPFFLVACNAGPAPAPAPTVTWALAIHGGAGVLSKNTPPAKVKEYEQSLERALQHGRDRLLGGASALDVCESVVRMLEDDPHFNAGLGAVFNEKGEHELDASIMDGSTLQCGAVAGVRTVKNPVSLARLVMTKTSHVLLVGDGAEQFATTNALSLRGPFV